MALGDIHILDLASNPGLLTIDEGPACIKTGSTTVTHLINLEHFKITLFQVKNLAENLPKDNEFRGILDTKILTLENALENIWPKSRSKRSWEALGSGIKWIAGNADADDLRTIYDKFNKLETNANEQIEINGIFEDRLNELSKIISETIKQKFNETFNSFQIINLILNLDLAKTKLEEIHEAISLSRIKVLSKNILGRKELSFVAQELEKQELVFSSISEMFLYLTPSIKYAGEIIYFHVSIPQVNGGFRKFFVEPLSKEGKEIETSFEEILIKGEKTFAIVSKCDESPWTTVCEATKIKEISEDPCVPKLARSQHGECVFRKAKSTTVRLIGDGKILVKDAVQPIQLQNSCGIGNHTLMGSFLVSFRNCSVKIGDHTFKNVELTTKRPFELLPIFNVTIKQKNLEPLHDLHQLHDLHIKTRTKLNEFHLLRADDNKIIIAIASVIVAIIILIVITMTIMIVKQWSPRDESKLRGEELAKAPTQSPATAPTQFLFRM